MSEDKTITQFLPLSTLSREQADRHYRRAHTAAARRLLRGMDQLRSYHINRADREYDLACGWHQRPRAFRFVILRFVAGRSLEFAPDVAERIAQDHRLFLRELRSFHVAEDVVVDRLQRHTALVKYLFEYERHPGMVAPDADQLFGAMVADLPTDAFGLRLVLGNRVRAEYASEAIDEPGQQPTRTPFEATTKVGFLEFWFDHAEWAEEYFAAPELRAALTAGRWALARGYRVTEECGFDRRASGS